MKEPSDPRRETRVGRVVKWLFGLVGIAFMAVAFSESRQRSQALPIPKPFALALAGILLLAGLMSLARAWTRLFQAEARPRALSAAFYSSQLGRYIPGAIWQVLAQVGLATDVGVSLPQASTAFAVFALVELAAGGTIGATLAAFGALPGAARISALAMVVPLLFLQRRWIVRALHLAERVSRRTFGDDLVPPQRAILLSYAWTLATVALNSLAFAVLLASLHAGVPILRGFSAFGFGWTVGFIAIPFPSGIGIREAVLMLTLGSSVQKSTIVAASVSQRLVGMVCEVTMIVASRIGTRAHPPRSAEGV